MVRDTGTAFLSWGADGAVANMKKGGKAKKDKRAKKPKKPRAKKAVKGDSVMLLPGNVPKFGGGSGVMSGGSVHRLASPGNLYGGGLPGPLQPSSYGSVPSVSNPLSRVEFIGSSDAYYNRNRVKSDDIPIDVNPSGIRAEVRPSIRLQPSSNPNAMPSVQYTQYNQHVWYGENPRVNDLNMKPSVRAMSSKPTTGYLMTHEPIRVDESGVGHLASEGLSASASASASESAFPQEPSAPPRSSSIMEDIAPKGGKAEVKYTREEKMAHMRDMVKNEFPTLKKLRAGGWETYDDAYESYYDNFADQYKRGGRVRSVF